MNCRRIESLLETHVDGELPAEQTLEVEAHLDGCERCVEQLRLMHAIHGSTQRAITEDADVSPEFLARVEAALYEEESRQRSQDRRTSFGPWRSVLPALAMAAGVMIWLGLRSEGEQATRSDGAIDGLQVLSATVGPDGALDRLIDYHSSPPQPQVTEPRLLPALEPNVGVRIRAPQLEEYGATWEGASLVPVDNHQAAYMRYRMPGHRVTVYVYDPRKVPVHRRLERQDVGSNSNPVYVGQWRGFSVAARENRGVGYAMAADLDAKELTRIISSIH